MACQREGRWYTGVRKSRSGRYFAQITWKKVNHTLGTFDTAEAAALAYDSAATSIRGSKTKINFPAPEDGVCGGAVSVNGFKRGSKTERRHYRGVRKRGWERYTAEIWWKKTRVQLGTFATQEEAALAYDGAARSVYGYKARTNFPASLMYAGGGVVVASNQKVEVVGVETTLFPDIIRRGCPVDLNVLENVGFRPHIG